MSAEATRNEACVPVAGATRALSAHVALLLFAMVILLFGCDSKLTPDQIAAIEKVETAKAAYLREFQPQLDSLKRCMDASQDSLKRCMDESLVERCSARCKPKFKPGSEKQVELERCVDRCLDDVGERRLISELCTKKSEDPSSCGKQLAAASKPSSADYDLALRICIEKAVPSDYCTGKRKYK